MMIISGPNSELIDVGDAAAPEKFYHIRCLRSAHRTCSSEGHSNVSRITAMFPELLILVHNTFIDDWDSLNFAEIN